MYLDAPLVAGTIRNSNFSSNQTQDSSNGSALSIFSSNPITIESTDFLNNTNSAFGSKGAALYTHTNTQTTVTLIQCNFKYNEAILGAAVFFLGHNLDIQSTEFKENGLENDTDDAVLFLHGGTGGTQLKISGTSKFSGNFGGDVTILDPITTT